MQSTINQISVIETVSKALATDNVVIHHDPPAMEATYGEFGSIDDHGFCPQVDEFLAANYPTGLYTHQAAAIASIQAGNHTVTATRTSSGKSLIYSLPVVNQLCQDPDSTSLFIYPQKALANDQLVKLREMIQNIDDLRQVSEKFDHFVSRYDGTTPKDDRPEIRKQARSIITNPDMLHFAMLQHHTAGWQRFFSNLKHVAIDECHEYRGVFGSNVGYILRRLRQVCDMYGSRPTLIATSATVNQPQQHMQALTGVPFNCIGSDADGSRQGRRKFFLASSDTDHYYDFGRKLGRQLADEGMTVLVFCPGRVAAERMMAAVKTNKDDHASFARVYRAGLSAAEREEIERGLRDKSVRLVFSTSALELGIDIGSIDAVVCVGIPQSMMSLWQRAGRAARGGREGAIVVIPADRPIDTYYANNPDELFAKENERLALNLDNQRISFQHYACAMSEIGGQEDNLKGDILGEQLSKVQEMRAGGKLGDEEAFYRAEPHMEINIRSMGGCYDLECNGTKIGDIDEHHLLREAYRNGIYRHGGKPYRVIDVIRSRRVVKLSPLFTVNDTYPFIQKKVKRKRRLALTKHPELSLSNETVDVTEFLVNVVEKNRKGETVNSWPGNAGMPIHPFPTEATLLLLDRDFWETVVRELDNPVALSALHSSERLIRSLFPTVSGPCDTQDFSSHSEILPTGEAAIYLYDLVYFGIGLTTVAFDQMGELIGKAIDRLDSCDCNTDLGCFKCIANPRADELTSKKATRYLLERIQSQLDMAAVEVVARTADESSEFETEPPMTCPTCSATCSKADRFCRNCGGKVPE